MGNLVRVRVEFKGTCEVLVDQSMLNAGDGDDIERLSRHIGEDEVATALGEAAVERLNLDIDFSEVVD